MALLIAAWAHVAAFFVFVVLLVFEFLSAKEISDEPRKKESDQIEISMVYEDSEPDTELVAVVPPVVEEVEESEDTVPPPKPEGFVVTREDQESGEKPDETALIGEFSTKASSDAGAEAGQEPMPALAGKEEVKSDVKTFDSDFADGKNAGPQDGSGNAGEAGEGDAEMTEKEALAQEKSAKPADAPSPEMESAEEIPETKRDDLAEIDQALKELEEALAQEAKPMKKVEETLPEKKATKASESSHPDGGFAPQTRKTKVKGVLSASGKGALDVENTPAGRYEAQIYRLLERSWQMENHRNKSLLAPGSITLYFVVDQQGKVSRQQLLSMIGASTTQWGSVCQALENIAIPKMPKDVIEDLEGDALELTVTFNY